VGVGRAAVVAANAVLATLAEAAGAARTSRRTVVVGLGTVRCCVLDAQKGLVHGLPRHGSFEGTAHGAPHGFVAGRHAAAVAHAHVHQLPAGPRVQPPPHAERGLAALQKTAGGDVDRLAGAARLAKKSNTQR